MLHRKIFAALLVCSSCALVLDGATADEFSYGFHTDEAVGVHGEVFRGNECFVRVRGPRGGSQVKGTYDNADGDLFITAEYGYLEIHGRAKRVIIRYVDTSACVNLKHLQIGDGGILVKSVDNASVLEIGRCKGPVQIRSVDNASVVEVPRGTKLDGKDRFSDSSRLVFAK